MRGKKKYGKCYNLKKILEINLFFIILILFIVTIHITHILTISWIWLNYKCENINIYIFFVFSYLFPCYILLNLTRLAHVQY